MLWGAGSGMAEAVRIVVSLVAAYLLGALPSAIVAGRLFGGIDIREHGSGNAGGTNVARVLGWKAGVSVMAFDTGKGAFSAAVIPLLLAGGSTDAEVMGILCGLAAVVGHVFPVYARFRGGKGVATGGGMLLAVAPIPTAVAVGVFGVVVAVSRRVSLGSLIGALAVPVSVLVLDGTGVVDHSALLLWVTVGLFAFIVFTHRANLRRLWLHRERPLF